MVADQQAVAPLHAALPAQRGKGDRILVLADPDEQIAHDLAEHLAGHQIKVVFCADGAEALLQTGLQAPEAVLVSAKLPLVPGPQVVEVVRRRCATPVVIGVGPDDAEEAVAALTAGASACVARPYRPYEVLKLLGGAAQAPAPMEAEVSSGPYTINPATFEARVRGRLVQLPLREFKLLHLLVANAEKVVTRDQISAELWGTSAPKSNTIAVHIRRLRDRIGDDPHHPGVILTVRNVGYRFVPPAL
ncbi:response regulator transcription factor [Streptomyces sp. A7024]|uniref:Response regulator transcription factor n=1 Tax=Streptomyces coryli TaxID=1128680 RepID=A0A6G4U4G7_9ACTN|nr:response regulator transcription factor [Streptomyces coryli]NGN66268.1 response regulator transcription factor [Streptomyces coryli]